MAAKNQNRVLQMDWKTLEGLLRTPSRGLKRDISSHETVLREYFGDEEFAYLRKLADRAARSRSRAPLLGNVIVINGIMGADLTVEDNGDQNVVWLSYMRLILGRFEELKLAPDGSQEADPGLTVFPSGLNADTYTRLMLWLGSRWHVEPFAFDWRKDIDLASNALAEVIRKKFSNKPVHLVAHSMGGLVGRNFIRLHPDLWDSIRDSNGSGGRLIMLGTPNYGSFAIPLALTGADSLVRRLATVDLAHDLDEVVDILSTFIGSYQMLPSPSKLPTALHALYQKATWDKFPISERHLQRALEFHRNLEDAATIDPDRMVYIAGTNQETISGLKILGPGKFEYLATYDGDGRVPHSLGLLKDVPAYYAEEAHGDLPAAEEVFKSVDDILECGSTSRLTTQPPARRVMSRAHTQWRSGIEEKEVARQLRMIAEQATQRNATQTEIRFAERTLLQAAMDRDARKREKEEPEQVTREVERIPLKVQVVLGDITQVRVPVVVVGHYKGMLPVENRAEGELDKAFGCWISKATQHGMVGADLGELFFIPVSQRQISADAVLLAGMGEMGRLTREDLRYLFANIALAISALGVRAFATVLIGSGEGNLSRDRALRGMLDGIYDGLRQLKKSERLAEFALIEVNKRSHEEILKIITALTDDGEFANLQLSVSAKKLLMRKLTRRNGSTRPPELPRDPLPGARIAIERDGDVFRFSALTKEAVVPVREVKIQSHLAESAAEHLVLAETKKPQERYGRLLHSYLVPFDFQKLIEDDDALTLVLDRSTAAFPWEMTCFRGTGRMVFFGPDLKLTRQFRTLLSSAPGIAPPLSQSLRILVIADPAPEPEFQLPGAREEGRSVVGLLRDIQQREKGRLRLDVVDCIGATQCDPVDLLALILDGDFDIIHFAGHGMFNESNPALSGWVFGKDCTLSARDIFRARRVPRLVFANACFSSVVRQGQPLSAAELNQDLAGLAEAFFERGVANYIGAGWPVEDQQAVAFAQVFYKNAIEKGCELGDALSEARKAILHQGSTWGAYQHYGQVNAKLVLG